MGIKEVLFNSYHCPNCGKTMVKHLDKLYHCENCHKAYGLSKKWSIARVIITILAYLFEAFLITYLKEVLQVPLLVNVMVVFGALIPILMLLKYITVTHLEEKKGVKDLYYGG